MQIVLDPDAQKDLTYWRKSGSKAILKKISQLMDAIQENPYTGIGKPEQLKYELKGLWSRRINDEHRFVYEIVEDQIVVQSLRGHYEKRK